MIDGGRIAIASILATGTVAVLVIIASDGTPIGERGIPLIGLLVGVSLLLLLPDILAYWRSRKDRE